MRIWIISSMLRLVAQFCCPSLQNRHSPATAAAVPSDADKVLGQELAVLKEPVVALGGVVETILDVAQPMLILLVTQ